MAKPVHMAPLVHAHLRMIRVNKRLVLLRRLGDHDAFFDESDR